MYPFTTPFLYDPAAGNLVLELDIPHSEGPSMRFDSVTGSPVVRNLSAPNAPNATSGQFYEAPVFQFKFESAPTITIRTSEVEVCCTSVPDATYRVESRTDVSPADWTPLVDLESAPLTSRCSARAAARRPSRRPSRPGDDGEKAQRGLSMRRA